MSGHSKWANIKFRKERQDAKRSKNFSKLARDIAIAVKLGGPDEDTNPRLRIVLQTARTFNLPRENVERAIKKGIGEAGGQIENFILEGYGPSGIAVLIEVLTDNRKRAISEIRSIFNKYNAKIAESGGVKWLFEQKGRILLSENQDKSNEEIEMAIINSGALDYSQDEGVNIIYTKPQDLDKVREILEKQNIKIENLALIYEAKDLVILDENQKEKVVSFLDELESIDDVSEVFVNLG